MAKNQHSAGRAVAAPPLRYVTRLLGVLAAFWLCAATGSAANAGQPWPAPRPNRLPGAHGQPWLEGQAAEPTCRDALTLARSVYFAAGPDLHPVSVDGKTHDFELLAYPATADSMSDIVADAQVFTPIAWNSPSADVPGQPTAFFQNAGYRQTKPTAGWRLATLLESTLGSGDQDGELQSTLHLREDVPAIWVAVALRPWAVQFTLYKSRDEVDAGLRLWSIQGKANRQIYDGIQQDYPIARRALTRYYERTIDLPGARAAALSDYTLDVAVRSYLVFHSDKGSSAKSGGEKPWKISL